MRNVWPFLIANSGLHTKTQVLLFSGVQWLARTTSITESWFAFASVFFFLMLQTGREFAYLSVAPLLDTGFDAQCSGIECDPGCG